MGSVTEPNVDLCVRADVACFVQATAVAVSGSYAYVVGRTSDSLAIVDVSNNAAPSLAGSLIDSTVMDRVRRCTYATQRLLYRAPPAHCTRPGIDGWGVWGGDARPRCCRLMGLAQAHRRLSTTRGERTCVSCRLCWCCVQARGVAVSGSYAYVVGGDSDSLAIVDVSNKAAPTLTGSLKDSTVMD